MSNKSRINAFRGRDKEWKWKMKYSCLRTGASLEELINTSYHVGFVEIDVADIPVPVTAIYEIIGYLFMQKLDAQIDRDGND